MNQGEMKSVLILIGIFILGVFLSGIGIYYFSSPPIPYYLVGIGIFLMAVSGLFIYHEVKD
ncbi:MAG: hypothetical protein KGL95_07450 [Patescibacteria group bacterium]|nr:hypothetical protein [Patescibacteria group bacterium]